MVGHEHRLQQSIQTHAITQNILDTVGAITVLIICSGFIIFVVRVCGVGGLVAGMAQRTQLSTESERGQRVQVGQRRHR